MGPEWCNWESVSHSAFRLPQQLWSCSSQETISETSDHVTSAKPLRSALGGVDSRARTRPQRASGSRPGASTANNWDFGDAAWVDTGLCERANDAPWTRTICLCPSPFFQHTPDACELSAYNGRGGWASTGRGCGPFVKTMHWNIWFNTAARTAHCRW